MNELEIQYVPLASLVPYSRNARTHSASQIDKLKRSLIENDWTNPMLVAGGDMIAGHGRLMAALALRDGGDWIPRHGDAETGPVIDLSHIEPDKRRAYIIADNRLAMDAGWDDALLRAEFADLSVVNFDLTLTGFSVEEIKEIQFPGGDGAAGGGGKALGSLAERFGIAPFSVLNAREGWWQERKRAWLSLGIKSEIGREQSLLSVSDTILKERKRKKTNKNKEENVFMSGSDKHIVSGTSIFDPVLCELSYRWFCPQGGLILDPFAGGSVRGIVASRLGRAYTGIELREEQVEANRAQRDQICRVSDPKPTWINGDSKDIVELLADQQADFLFGCPPYADLERYSDDPRDLSTMEYEAFKEAYFAIIAAACTKLRDDRFAAFVVGDIRDRRGIYRNFTGHTVEAFLAAGLQLYNEAILVTAAGSLPIRAGKQFASSRKLGKTHQNIYVFVKGDPIKATRVVGEVEFGEIGQEVTLDPADPASYGAPL